MNRIHALTIIALATLAPATRAQLSLATAPADESAIPAASEEERYWRKDSVSLRQEIDTFTSLEDGQPAAPGDWEMEMDAGWAKRRHGAEPALVQPRLKYTPHRYSESGYELWEASQLRLRMPLAIGVGDVPGNGDLDFGWQERWIKEHGLCPSISTLAEIRIPNGHESSGADGTFTGIVAKDLGPGTAYGNAWLRTANGNNIEDMRHFQWGFRAGYKWQLSDRTSLLANYVHQSSEQTGHGNINLLELAAEFRTKHHLAFGPGIWIGLDNHVETPPLVAGFRLVYLFNARNPPPPGYEP